MSAFTGLRRAAGMSAPEIACRIRQEAAKRMERVAGVVRPSDGARGAGDGDRRVPRLPDGWREVFRSRFFPGAARGETPVLTAGVMGGEGEPVLAAAERIRRGRFDLLGYDGLWFGDPVDWHLDPISGKRAPLVHWSRVDPAAVGDVKVIWELNRHQWLLPLGVAYRLTGEERYAESFAGYLQEWMRANPTGVGINWASSLEAAVRLVAWCWALALFEGSRVFSSDLAERLAGGIASHARHIERYLSFYFSPNTHLTGEALGLLYAGLLLPALPRSARWRSLGRRVLIEQCGHQIHPDGVYVEQSTCYQRYTAEIYLHLLILADRNGIPLPAAVTRQVRALLDFLLAVRQPDGAMPEIGDADGGWLLPLAARSYRDMRGIFAVAAALFDRSDYASAAGGPAPELLWLLGPEGMARFEAHSAPGAGRAASRLFAAGGYAIMRSGPERSGHQMIFDVGPLGCRVSAGHGHADLLGIQCAVFGAPFLVDPGTYGYADAGWRGFFRGTAAHSTVRIDGAEQARPAGRFKWQERPGARLRRWCSTESFDFADAEHDAYARLPDPVHHRRRVLFLKPRCWIIVDDLAGRAEHRVELQFQFAPEVEVTPGPPARASIAGGRGLLLVPFSTRPLQGSLHRGETDPPRGWVSAGYGRRVPAPMLVYSAAARLPLRILTALIPVTDHRAAPPVIVPLTGGAEALVGLAFDDGGSVRFDGPGLPQIIPGRER